MRITTSTASLVGNIVKGLIKLNKKSRGETAPGLMALKFDPQFIKNTNHHVPTRIVISGTNGKTTTTRMITAIADQEGISYINNRSGSNLLRGIASMSLKIKKDTTHVIWEADEAALIEICQQVKPTHLLLTNLFRDQLDRYGEIDTVLKKWIKLLAKLPKLNLIVNADDPNLVHLAQLSDKHTLTYFSVNTKGKKQLEDSSDAIFCPKCHLELEYKSISFSHIGNYFCKCGFSRPEAPITASNISTQNGGTDLKIGPESLRIPLIGLYNVYNATAAWALTRSIDIPQESIQIALKSFKTAFGRQETIRYNKKNYHLMLIKNPAGCNQVLDTLDLINKKLTLIISINDRFADGKDVSWLWDADFEKMAKYAKNIYITGDRALDMSTRLKYANISTKKIITITNYRDAVKRTKNLRDNNIYVLPTYTALWEIRPLLLGAKHRKIQS